MSRALYAPLLALSLLTAAPTLAHADYGEGAFRLGAGSTLFSIEHLPEPGSSVILYGLPIIPYQTGIHVGYMLTGEIYLGLQLAVGGMTVDTGGFLGSTDLLQFTMLPRFLYQIPFSSNLNIYFGAESGFSIIGDPDGNPEDIFKVAGVAGVSFFASDSFSIDGDLSFGFTHHPDSGNAGIQVGLNVIFSGWMGGDHAESSSTDERPTSWTHDPGPTLEPAAEPEPEPEPEPIYDDPESGLQ